MRVFRQARTERQQATKLLNDVTESATARLLFHGLNPTSCPRCDQQIDDARRRQERHAHTCAVCAREVTGDDEDPQEITAEAQQRLETSTAAEAAAKQALEQAETTVDGLTRRLEGAQEQLRRAQSAADLPARLAAQENVPATATAAHALGRSAYGSLRWGSAAYRSYTARRPASASPRRAAARAMRRAAVTVQARTSSLEPMPSHRT
ncbi:hypothetical protein [Streptomyces avermitilis]|uniref:hypothetical protein n=1 Tax=Streptomyces avermitilis TaxID=33903 RepID=UPI0033A649CB